MKVAMTPAQLIVTKDIIAERARQTAKFGVQFHNEETFLAILGEEVGECNNAFLEMKFTGRKTIQDLRTELVQVAAVAMQFVEVIDRRQKANEATKKMSADIDECLKDQK